MPTLTGYKQATIAYRTDAYTGRALDVDGNFVGVSGKRQAIKLLAGYPNPDPNKYEIMGYFDAGAILDGSKTAVYSPTECPPDTSVNWILDTGYWDNSAYWLNGGIWNY